MIKIWTDGSCSPNPGPGGWGYLLRYPSGREVEKCGGLMKTTNNAMELTAVIEVLSSFTKPRSVLIYPDSMYVLNGATKWVEGWKKKGWRTSTGPVANVELWKKLLPLLNYHKVQWQWVKGHASCEENHRADELANKGRLKALKNPNSHETYKPKESIVEKSKEGIMFTVRWHREQAATGKNRRFHLQCAEQLEALL